MTMIKKYFIFWLTHTLALFFFLGCSTTHSDLTARSKTALMLIRIGKEKKTHRLLIALHEKEAPRTVANFKKLTSHHYYNGLLFYRTFPHALVQTGDPKARYHENEHSGTSGPGYTIAAEIKLPHQRGSVAMARLPDRINPLRASNGSQFFICLEPLPQLNNRYTVFGQVLEGMDVLDKISTIPTNGNNFPLQKVVITSLSLQPLE